MGDEAKARAKAKDKAKSKTQKDKAMQILAEIENGSIAPEPQTARVNSKLGFDLAAELERDFGDAVETGVGEKEKEKDREKENNAEEEARRRSSVGSPEAAW